MGAAPTPPPPSVLERVDHLVYATSDLNRGIEDIETLLGVRATPGGRHPGRGTRNALLALGGTRYLEILAPDPDQPSPAEPWAFAVDGLESPRLVAWAAKGEDLQRLVSESARKGVRLGEVASGSRKSPGGVVLSWTFTNPRVLAGGLIPFLIDWGQSPHPAQTSPRGATLVALRAEHPDVAAVRRMLEVLGIDLPVAAGPKPALIALIDCPKGKVELR
jgi:Glyoxalase-like domain